jgi:hypothetical protein
MFLLFASLVALAAGIAYIVSYVLTPSAPVALSGIAGPDPMFPTLSAEELLEIDRQEEGFELASAGFKPFTLVMVEDDDTLIFCAFGTDSHMAVHKSWLETTPKTYGELYWFMPDVNYGISVEQTYPDLFRTNIISSDWTGGNFSEVDLPSHDTTRCLSCLQHHHQVGECFCSSACEASFGAPRELVMEF